MKCYCWKQSCFRHVMADRSRQMRRSGNDLLAKHQQDSLFRKTSRGWPVALLNKFLSLHSPLSPWCYFRWLQESHTHYHSKHLLWLCHTLIKPEHSPESYEASSESTACQESVSLLQYQNDTVFIVAETQLGLTKARNIKVGWDAETQTLYSSLKWQNRSSSSIQL